MEPTVTTHFQYTTKQLTNTSKHLKKADEKRIHDLARALDLGNWCDAIFEDRSRLPYLALRCYHDETITPEQFATLMIYWSALKHHPHWDILPCDWEHNTSLIKKTFAIPKKIDKKFQNHYHKAPHLSPKQQARFFELMKEVPPSERTFFLVPDFQHRDGAAYSISQAIEHNLGINVFNRVVVDGKTMRMIPSFAMMQAFLQAFAGEELAVRMNPGLGVWEWEDIRNDHLEGRRVLGLPFPGVKLPHEADGYSVPQDYDFIYHDFYHAFILSLVPFQHRKAFMAIEKVLRDFQEEMTNKTKKMYVQKFSEALIDMEFTSYRRETISAFKKRFNERYTQDIIFWDSLREAAFVALEKIHTQESQKLLERYPDSIVLLHANRLIIQLQNEDNVIPEIAERVMGAVRFQDFEIDLDSLQQFKRYVVSDIKQELMSRTFTPPSKERVVKAAKRDIILQLCVVKKKEQCPIMKRT